jgi:hypothetical protein
MDFSLDKSIMKSLFSLLLSLSLFISSAVAQSISLPPSGDNQKCAVTQWIGLASITITYNSPDVTGPDGLDRKGKIWGGVVPYGMASNNFGTAQKMPWRAGANENTTISFSHDMKVEGQDIEAGTYGLHMIPGKEKWVIIFNRNSGAWGSYFYNEKDDALRVEVIPEKNEYTEWLTYDFIEKKPTYTLAVMKWEELRVPFRIEADVIQIYLTKIREELQNSPGFSWQNWVAAVNFCMQHNVNLDEAILWADYAIEAPFVGEKNFETLSTKGLLFFEMNKNAEADILIKDAVNQPTANMVEIHNLGRQLIGMGYAEKAVEIFEMNHQKYPDDNFTTMVGLARGYEAIGKKRQAIRYYLKAAENAPEGQKEYYMGLADNLK